MVTPYILLRKAYYVGSACQVHEVEAEHYESPAPTVVVSASGALTAFAARPQQNGECVMAGFDVATPVRHPTGTTRLTCTSGGATVRSSRRCAGTSSAPAQRTRSASQVVAPRPVSVAPNDHLTSPDSARAVGLATVWLARKKIGPGASPAQPIRNMTSPAGTANASSWMN